MQPSTALLSRLLRFARSNPLATLGFALVLLSLLLMAFGASLAPYPPERTVAGAILLPPNAAHWFGTDNVGFDIFSRVIAAPRIDIYIAVTSTFLALAIGIPLGVVTGYVGGERGVWGLLSEWTMRLLDVIQAFPVFILALALVAALGASQQNIVAVLVILQAPVFLRLTRGAAMAVKGSPYIEAARCAGASTWAVMLRHVLPNAVSPALIGSSVAVGQAILITAGLSFVGAGVEATSPEWGGMIATGATRMITGQWWPSVFPGLALGLTVLGYAILGEHIRLAFDPTRRR
jgi:peptide/nickel transport system permease protein